MCITFCEVKFLSVYKSNWLKYEYFSFMAHDFYIQQSDTRCIGRPSCAHVHNETAVHGTF